MAYRIDEHVLRGEIDNRTRDVVLATLWLVGRVEPLTLRLRGNAWRDLAGRRLTFTNPSPTPLPDNFPNSFAGALEGSCGDITASRKVKIPDLPIDEFIAARKLGLPAPWHWANSLYFEFYGDSHGRVVIESADYQLTLDPESAWDMSEAEETAQRAANAVALQAFMRRLLEAMEQEPEE